MSNTYASIYTTDGNELTTGLQGDNTCPGLALKVAQTFADDLQTDVELIDDDGRWLVHPMDPENPGYREGADFLGEIDQDEEA